MSKETSKKTGLSKLGRENLGGVNGGYKIETCDDGTVKVSGMLLDLDNKKAFGTVKFGDQVFSDPFVVKKEFNSFDEADKWAKEHLRSEVAGFIPPAPPAPSLGTNDPIPPIPF